MEPFILFCPVSPQVYDRIRRPLNDMTVDIFYRSDMSVSINHVLAHDVLANLNL
jgi:hypothetical protein